MDVEQITAYHEAGHVVLALFHGGSIVQATIDPPNDDGPRRYGETIVAWGPRQSDEELLAEVAVSLAGPIAEMLYIGECSPFDSVAEWWSDWQRAAAFAAQCKSKQRTSSSLLESETKKVRALLNSPNGWAAVSAIADLLLAFETVEHNQCEETVQFWLPS